MGTTGTGDGGGVGIVPTETELAAFDSRLSLAPRDTRMAIDRIDGVAFVGFALLVVASLTLDRIAIAAAFGGFALSLSVWRLYGGRPWEALGWLAWVGAAVALVVELDILSFLVVFGGFGLIGACLLVGSRLELFPAIWRVDSTETSGTAGETRETDGDSGG